MMLKPLAASAFVDSGPSLSIPTKRGVRLRFLLGDEAPLPCVRFIGVWILGSACPSTSEAASRMKFFCSLVKGFPKFFRKFFSSFIKVSDGLGSINRFWVGFAIQIQKEKTRH